MKNENLWPFSTRAALLSLPVTLAVLTIATAIAAKFAGWPRPESERWVLLGAFVLSLVPLLLVIVDALMKHGAVLEYKGIKLNLAQVAPARTSSESVPANIGVAAGPVNDSSSVQILEALRNASKNEVVVVDLQDGKAWWETRLLVLLAGASRLGRPHVVVFLATEGGRRGLFQGWGRAPELFESILRADSRYLRTYYSVRSAVMQWMLLPPATPGGAFVVSPGPNPLAAKHPWMAIDNSSGLPNEFGQEQLLASELGEQIESVSQQRSISTVRLQELFKPVLITNCVDRQSSFEAQLREFIADQEDYVAVTNTGEYVLLARKMTVLATMVASEIRPSTA